MIAENLQMDSWQVALYGILTVSAMGVVQYFITAYFRKSEKMKEDEITKIFEAIRELNTNVKILTEKISDQSISIALCKEKIAGIEMRLNEHERRLNKNN